MATWIDLFGGPAGPVYHDPTEDNDWLKPSVHEWNRHGADPPVGGHTLVSGGGLANPGLDRLQPLKDNAFANFGGLEHKYDAGIIKFKIGAALDTVGDGIEFGVHFNTNRHPPDDGGPASSDANTGYAVFVKTGSPPQLLLYRINDAGSPSERQELIDSATPSLLPGDVVEVQWGYTALTGNDHGGQDWGIKVFVHDRPSTQEVISHDREDSAADTDDHLAGGYVGVCGWDDVDSTENFITRFGFTDLIKRLSEPGLENTPYKGTEHVYGLYTNENGEATNKIPDDWAAHASDRAAHVHPLDANGQVSPVKGIIGFVSIGMSSTGQIWSGFARRANDPGFVVRNPLLRLVNCARGGVATEQWMEPDGPAWSKARQKLLSAGLSIVDTPGQVPWRAPQVQVVWLNASKRFDSNTPNEGGFPVGADTLRNHLWTIYNLMRGFFPNLQLVLCSAVHYIGWLGLYHRDLGEPNMGESTRFGYKKAIQTVIDGWRAPPTLPPDTPWMGWLEELWAPDTVWREAFFPPDDIHPNAAGEDFGGGVLLRALNTHLVGEEAWWSGQAPSDRSLLSVPASDDAWVRNDFAAAVLPSPDVPTLNHHYMLRQNKRYRVFIKFLLDREAGTPVDLFEVTHAYLQLCVWEKISTFGLECKVYRVDSNWDGAALTAGTAPSRLDENGNPPPEISTPPETPAHTATIDVMELIENHRNDRNADPTQISFELEPEVAWEDSNAGPAKTNFLWYSRHDQETRPNRGPQLNLVVETQGQSRRDRLRP